MQETWVWPLSWKDPLEEGRAIHSSIVAGRSLLRFIFHWVSNDIQPFYPLSFPYLLAFNLAQHQSLFQWVCSLHKVAKVLELPLQYQSFQWIFRTYFLQDRLIWSLCCPKDSQESFPISQLKSINCSILSLFNCPALTSVHDYWKKHSFDYMDLCWQSDVSAF